MMNAMGIFFPDDGRALTNRERQANFRRRNPGYYRQYRLRVKARMAALQAERAAAEQLALAAANAPKALPAPVQRLALPAPVEQLVILAPRPERELVPAIPEQRPELKHLAV